MAIVAPVEAGGNGPAGRLAEPRSAEREERKPGGAAALGKLTKFADTFDGSNSAESRAASGFAAKSHAKKPCNFREVTDKETGEVTLFETVKGKRGNSDNAVEAYDQDAADLERWMLKQYARRALMVIEQRDKKVKKTFVDDFGNEFVKYRPSRSNDNESPGDVRQDVKKAAVYRVVNCSRDKITKKAVPQIWKSNATKRTSYHNVGVCGSVWTCPTCSRRINLGRREEIAAAYNTFVGSKDAVSDSDASVRNGDAMMVTFTIKHGIGDDLQELFTKLKEADRRFLQKSYAYKKLVGYSKTVKGVKVEVPSVLSFVGRISTSEITYGSNGWHPHLHQLWFFDRRLKAKEITGLRKELFAEWSKACLAVGLPAPVETIRLKDGTVKYVGVDVRRALSAEEYMAKYGVERNWGPEAEMASSHAKSGRKGRTAFQLLYDYAQGDERSGKLFKVFAEATLGKHQLEFSKRLRARLAELGIKEILERSDEELAATMEAESVLLGSLTDADFKALCNAEKHGIEGHGTMLAMCKMRGFDESIKWLRSLPSYEAIEEPIFDIDPSQRLRRVVVEGEVMFTPR